VHTKLYIYVFMIIKKVNESTLQKFFTWTWEIMKDPF